MSLFNNIIPTEVLLKMAEELRPFEQIPLIETTPEYTIDEEFLTSVVVAYKYVNESGSQMGTHSSVDHPAFAALREHLGVRGYIEIQREWRNGDTVLKRFTLNTFEFEPGDQFSSAGAMGNSFSVQRKIQSRNTSQV